MSSLRHTSYGGTGYHTSGSIQLHWAGDVENRSTRWLKRRREYAGRRGAGCHDADDTDSAVFAVDEDGDLYAGNTNDSIAMNDGLNDPALLRGFDHAIDELGLAKGMIKNRWDDFVKTRDTDLVELGVLGDTVENGGLYCVTQHTKLMNSAIWQVYSMLLDVIDSLPRETQDKLRKVVPNQLLLEVA